MASHSFSRRLLMINQRHETLAMWNHISDLRNISTEVSKKFTVPPGYEIAPSMLRDMSRVVAKFTINANLGLGFPDYYRPEHVNKMLLNFANNENPLLHQYTSEIGHPQLVEKISELYSPLICQNIDPVNEVLVTNGAHGALHAAILVIKTEIRSKGFITMVGLVNDGDEVIMIDPVYICYEPMVRAAGGTAKVVSLKLSKSGESTTSSDWLLDEEELASMFNDRTKVIILNTPHNFTGKVFTKEELEMIAGLCKKYNVVCISDEAYEFLVFKPKEHIRIASLPDMWERTITISSAGKTFFVTGWRIGWAYAPANLMHNLFCVHRTAVQEVCTPFQVAVAETIDFELKRLDSPDSYFKTISEELLPKRDFVVNILKDAGFHPTVPDGGYFVVGDWTPLEAVMDLSGDKSEFKDIRFAKKLAEEAGVLAIPCSALYTEQNRHQGENFIRFCYVKTDEKLELAKQSLEEWKTKKHKA